MNTHSRFRRPLGRYALGQLLVLVGAASIDITGSFIPLALAGSAALMLTAPLVRQIAMRRPPPR